MELTAAAEALEYLFYNEICVPFDSIKIYTDSAYLHNCVKQKWYVNWQNNGWKNSKKEPIANRDLWERLINYFEMLYLYNYLDTLLTRKKTNSHVQTF